MAEQDIIRVAVIDDQNLFRQSLCLLIGSVSRFELVTDCPGGEPFLEQLKTTSQHIDIAIVDMDMPGMSGMELNKKLQQQYPYIKVIILTVHMNEHLIAQAINAGASSYLAKNCDKDELVLAVDTVYKTGFYFNNDAMTAIKHSANHKKQQAKDILSNLPGLMLSKRERQVLHLICREFNNTEIAQELFLSTRTVEGHRINLLNKVNCRNTAGLVLFAIKAGLFEIPL